METKKIFKILALLLLVFTALFIFFGISRKGKPNLPGMMLDADGTGMVSIRFNKSNKKAIEVRCSESERSTDDEEKVLMKNIEAEIYKDGRMNQDIRIAGDTGTVENNFFNFVIKDNARISSKDLQVLTDSFLLKDRALITTDKRVNYQVKFLEGVAKKGMRLNIKKNILFLYETLGTYNKEGKSFDYTTDMLKFEDQQRALRLQDGNEISNEQTVLKGDRILLLFFEEYKNVKEISSWGNSYFYFDEDPETPGEKFREVSANHIQHMYNEEGKLEKTELKQDVEIRLKSEASTTDISSQSLVISYYPETEKLRTISTDTPTKLISKGKHDIDLKAYKLDIDYDENGEIGFCKARGNTTFKIGEYSGNSFLMTYDVGKNDLALRGKGSKVMFNKNSFESIRFFIDTKKRTIESSTGVLSIIVLDTQKSNVLFSKDLIYINAQQVKVSQEKGEFIYKDNVNLLQKETKLTASKLRIDEENNIVASGKEVSLIFNNKDERVRIKGKKITFDALNSKVEITNGIIENEGNLLRAKLLTIAFSKKNEILQVNGEGSVDFLKEKDSITGSSEKVEWLFEKNEIVFIDSAQITRKERGTTKGDKLRFFIKDNRIIIISDESKRTETIIEK